MMQSLSPYLEFIQQTAYQAGQLTLRYFQQGVHPDHKADGSPVTIADRSSEQFIRTAIEQAYPQHAIVGEEFGEKASTDASHRWFIDPIDGTQSFIHGVPLYAVLIGLEIEGRVEVGAAYFPALDEMLVAASGLGCWWNGRQAHVSAVDCLEDACFTFTSPKGFYTSGHAAPFERLSRQCFHSVGWSDAYGYMLVATGRAEITLDPKMCTWDCGPFPPIFREAGGIFGDWHGQETIYAGEALATTPALLPQVLAVLEEN